MIGPARATSLRAALTLLELPASELWVAYLGMGGDLPISAIEHFVSGSGDLTAADYDRLVQIVNEEFMDRGEDHPVPYSDEMDD